MSWRRTGVRDQRVEFVVRANRGESLSGLCREYEITRPTGYLWLRRFREQGVAGMEERSRRPHGSPSQTRPELEERIVALRRQRPDWGARKLAVLLERDGIRLPVITVHRILARHGLVLDQQRRRQATSRFERERPNELWQMDFKGQKDSKAAIGPLSVLDDHSRYLVALQQTGTTRSEVVREHLEEAFTHNGLPEAMLMDHGVPWWSARAASGWTQLMVWLIKQGVRCHFSRAIPRHRARWSGSMARWSGRAAGPMPANGWSRVGWTTSATSTTSCVRTKRWICKPPPAYGVPAPGSTIPTRPPGTTESTPS